MIDNVSLMQDRTEQYGIERRDETMNRKNKAVEGARAARAAARAEALDRGGLAAWIRPTRRDVDQRAEQRRRACRSKHQRDACGVVY